MDVFRNIRKLVQEEEGAVMLEYALMAVLIAAACALAVGFVGDTVLDLFTRVNF
jgi:Flp pilus assembly pilin Flp